ncbi:MAG: LysR family transcriptional regulator [Oscillospiraceae bacterium]|jgi:DNA-binding transcriptional LysR family regulator|nr:LysR family transcriptional regulator [Oscillospiraceae bacterium]
MDVRILKYFLAVAREGNITKAAEALHVTQPTLSRQLMDLENEMGAELLRRGKRNITLTTAGTLFQQRAQEIVALLDKTRRDIAEHNDAIGGTISIGCVETAASLLLPDALEAFHSRHPMVRYEIYSANGDGIRDKLDSGQVDMGILVEPVEVAKYEFVRLAFQDTWGVLMRREDPLAKKENIRVGEIVGLPLFLSHRRIVTDEIESWLGEHSNLHIVATHDFITNIMLLIERGLGYAVTLQGAYSIRPSEKLRFIPFSPERKSGHVMAWKKNRIFGQAASLFMDYIKDNHHTI